MLANKRAKQKGQNTNFLSLQTVEIATARRQISQEAATIEAAQYAQDKRFIKNIKIQK